MSANASKPQTIEPVDHIYDDNVVTYLFPDFIPLDEILWDQKTLVTKNNSICQLIRLSGIDVQGLSKEEIDKLHNMRRAFFANDALDKDVCLAFHSRRKKEQFKKTSFSYEDEL
ncbi:MAG: hypothetical protein MRY49_03275, partial [Candidatus Pacebacteria bacterium]|nr:hypothetical protein [Candidatus Paceibacterota bacterium]